MKNKKILFLSISIIIVIGVFITTILSHKQQIKSFTNIVLQKITTDDNEQEEVIEEKAWYDDFEYTLEDNYINLTKIKETVTDTEYTLPAKATIDGVEYTTRLYVTRIFADSPITKLKIEDGVRIDNNGGLFSGSNITDLDMSNIDLSNLNNLYFLDGSVYTNLNFSGSNMSNISYFNINGSRLFPNAEKVDFSNANLEKLVTTDLGGGKIKNLDFSNANLKSATFYNGFFTAGTFENVSFSGASLEGFTYGNYSLNRFCVTNLDFSSASMPNIESLSSVFANSTCLKKLDISNLELPKLKYMNNTFENNPELEEIIMDGFKSNVEGSNAYNIIRNTPKLKKFKLEGMKSIRNLVPPTLEELEIKNVEIIEKDTSYGCDPWNGPSCILKKLTIEQVNKIEEKAFASIKTLDDITFIGDIPTIEQYAFYYKPAEYEKTWSGYDDVDRVGNYNSDFSPVAKITKLTYDDPRILLYDFKRDTRFITDGEEHKITYNLNFEGPDVVVINFTAGDRVRSDQPTRNEYTFRGWNTSPNGEGQLYAPNETIYSNRDITLYAQWRKRAVDPNNEYSGWLGESVRWRVDPSTSTGYIYPADENSDGVIYDQVDEDNSRLTMPSRLCYGVSNIVFEEGITYIGKYFYHGCSSLTSVKFPSTLKTIGEGAFIQNVQRIEGLDFEKVELQNRIFYSSVTCVPMHSGNVYWSQCSENLHNITIDANGGTYSDGTTSKQYQVALGSIEYTYDYTNKEYYSEKKNSQTIEIPEKEGYVFESLNTKPDGSGKRIDIENDELVLEVPTDLTLYVIYQKDKIKITYNTGDIEFETPEQELYYGDSLIDTHPEKEGYIFAEWNTKQDGSGKGYYPNQIIKDKEDLVLYPIFRKPIALENPKPFGSAGNYKVITQEDGTELRLIRTSHDYYTGDNAYYEVSKEYLENFKEYQGIKFDDYVYNELMALLATYSEYNEGGFFDTAHTPDRFYDIYHDMPYQLTERIVDAHERTSNNGAGEKCIHALRFIYVFEHSDYIAKKYRLRVFTNGKTIYTGIEPIKATVTIRAIDEDTEEPLEGMVLGVFTSNKELIDIITMGNSDYTMEIPVGNDYIVERLENPEGYYKKDPGYFSITLDNLEGFVLLTDRKERESNPDIINQLIENPNTRDGILIIIAITILLGFITYKTYKKAKFYN